MSVSVHRTKRARPRRKQEITRAAIRRRLCGQTVLFLFSVQLVLV